MPDIARLQEIHNEMHGKKHRRKELAQTFKDELAQHARYQELLEELETLKIEKNSIENLVREAAPKDAAELEDLKVEIKADEELLSDLAMTLIMQNEIVELVDEQLNRYVAHMLVKFKKDGMVDTDKQKKSTEA